jgi:hypothetical protein
VAKEVPNTEPCAGAEDPSMIPTTVSILTIVVGSTGPPASLLISINEPLLIVGISPMAKNKPIAARSSSLRSLSVFFLFS